MGLLCVTLFAMACGSALVLNTTTPDESRVVASMTQNRSNPGFTSVGTVLPQTNAMRNTDCQTTVKANDVFGIKLFNPFALAGNKTCSSVLWLADTPVAYPPTPQSPIERTIKTIKREPRAVPA